MTTKELLALVADWRRAAHQLRGDCEPMPASAMRLDECADELEAALASDTGERGVDYTDIANRAQAVTGRSIYPSTVKAILDAAALRAQPAGGGCETCDGKGYVVRYTDPYNRGDVSSPYDAPCGDCTPPESGGQGDMDYTPGVLDSTAPPRIWLQVDTSASNDERDEAFPADLDGVTWQDESIGGLEVQYVRADLTQGGGNGR